MRLSRSTGPAYLASRLLKSENHMDDVILKLFRWMDKFATDRGPMHLDHYLAYAAFDVVGELFFSRSFGFIEQGRDIGGALASAKGVQAMGAMLGYFQYFFYFLVNPLTTWLGLLPLGFIYNTTLEAVKERETNPDARFDGLALWMKTHRDAPDRLSLREIYATSTTVVQAGAETVSCKCAAAICLATNIGKARTLIRYIGALQSFLYYTIRHPETWNRMRKELAAEQARGRCRDSVISFADTQKLVYFLYAHTSLVSNLTRTNQKSDWYNRACIKESMRVLGPTGMGLQRIVPEQGLSIAGHHFKAGVVLSVHVP